MGVLSGEKGEIARVIGMERGENGLSRGTEYSTRSSPRDRQECLPHQIQDPHPRPLPGDRI